MIGLDKFTDATGKVDWEGLERARTDVGERCYECGSLVYPEKGCRALCRRCGDLHEDEGEVNHTSRLRCPKCGHLWNADREESELYGEGSHEVCCRVCEHEFEVVTEVSYSWRSPALMEKKAEIEAGA